LEPAEVNRFGRLCFFSVEGIRGDGFRADFRGRFAVRRASKKRYNCAAERAEKGDSPLPF